MKRFLIFDANSLIHRCYHALPPLNAPDGAPVNVLYGLANILLKLWRTAKPDYAVAMFDRKEPTFREKLYKEYKAHRPPTPGDLVPQIETARGLFALFGVKSFDLAGFEADDLIGTLVERFKNERGVQFAILSGDADELQLVDGDRVVVGLSNPYHPEHQHRQGNRMALANISERLLLHFDVEAKLDTGIDGERYRIGMAMPYRRAP